MQITNEELSTSLLVSEKQRHIQHRARVLALDRIAPRADDIDRTDVYPMDLAGDLAANGFMGMIVPTEYGGSGASLFDAILVAEEVAKVSAVVARIVVDANSAVPKAIMHYGTEEQKREYLPWIVAGDKPAIAITEPEAGSAAGDIQTTAVLDGDFYRVNGRKQWITGGGVSRLYLVFVRLHDKPGAAAIGGLIVENTTPGFLVAGARKMMGVHGIPEADLAFTDCSVPRGNLLVEAEGGFKKLMTAYNCQRLGAAAIALGISDAAFHMARDYSRTRKQGGVPIGEFQGLRWMLADMYVKIEAARLLIYSAAANAGSDFPSQLEAATAKLFAAESAIDITNAAMQIHGALGYSCDLPIERMQRDARMFAIGGGTTQVLRNGIASKILGQ